MRMQDLVVGRSYAYWALAPTKANQLKLPAPGECMKVKLLSKVTSRFAYEKLKVEVLAEATLLGNGLRTRQPDTGNRIPAAPHLLICEWEELADAYRSQQAIVAVNTQREQHALKTAEVLAAQAQLLGLKAEPSAVSPDGNGKGVQVARSFQPNLSLQLQDPVLAQHLLETAAQYYKTQAG